MWRGEDVVYNVLGCLVLGMAIEMPPIAYREPQGGNSAHLDSPRWWGGIPPPPAVWTYQAYELLRKFMGWVL